MNIFRAEKLKCAKIKMRENYAQEGNARKNIHAKILKYAILRRIYI